MGGFSGGSTMFPRRYFMTHRTTLVAATGVIAGVVAIAAPAAGAAQPVKVDVKHGVLEVRGTHADDSLVLQLDARDPQTILVNVDDGSSQFRVARDRVDRIDVDARGGDDSVVLSDAGGAFTTTIPTTVDGGSGDDTLTGANGDETCLGGGGNDKVDGNRGSDVVALGAGDDQATWDPGDGSDVVDGDRGQDTLEF